MRKVLNIRWAEFGGKRTAWLSLVAQFRKPKFIRLPNGVRKVDPLTGPELRYSQLLDTTCLSLKLSINRETIGE